MASVVAKVLALGSIPAPDANFFALGGDSLAALEVTTLLQEDLGRDVPLELLFDCPVLGEFADALRRLSPDDR